MIKGKIVIISGPSGSGKTTLHKMLLNSSALKGKLVKSISVTTRSMRDGEKQGHDYIFVSPKMFQYKVKAKHFLEAQKVFDHYYGTPKKNVCELLMAGKHVLLCIDVKGAQVLRKKFPQAVSIFIKTPSMAILKQRLEKRAQNSHESKELRLKIAQQELAQAKFYNYKITNDHLQTAYHQLEEIVCRTLF